MSPGDVLNIGQAAGRVHFGWDVAEAGAASRVLYPPSDIDAGLDINPEFTSTLDNWVQCSVQADAPTTSGSGFPRSEGREYQEGSDTSLGFDPKDGQTHWIRFRARQVEHPLVDNVGIATGQLHSSDDDIVMVRTRMEGTTTNTLVLKVYDPNINNTVDVLTLDANYQFNSEYDLMFLIHGDWVYVFYQDFTQYVYRFATSILPSLTTYFFKSGAYIQFNETTSGVDPTDIGTVHIKNLHHWHTGWAAPQNYFNCPEVDPGASANVTVNQEFTRTATETGTGITERKWAILAGPNGAGTSIGTSASLSWTPTVAGDYVLIYGAKNAEGWSNPTFLNVTVSEGGGGGGGGMGIRARRTGTGTGSLSYAVPLPIGAVSGDRVVVGFANDHAHTTASPSTGWTDHGEAHEGATTNQSLSVFSRVLDGTGNDSLTVTLTDSGGHTDLDIAYAAICMEGDGGAPQLVFNSGGSATTGTVGSIGPLSNGDYDSLIFLGLDNNGNPGHTVSPPTNWANTQQTGNTVTVIAASMDRALTGVTSVSPGNVTWTNADQWITGHVVMPAVTGTAPIVNAGLDANTAQHSEFNRTATEDDGGAPITSREWEVISGPAQVGETLSTAAALAWTPRTDGAYVLRYSATNSIGTGSDDVTITVDQVVFPISINLTLNSTITGAKHVEASRTINLLLNSSITGEKQGSAAVTAALVLSADADGIFTHAVTAHLDLSALISGTKAISESVTTALNLSAQVTDPEHHTDSVPVTALLDLLGSVTTSSVRHNNNVTTNLILSPSIIGQRIIAEAARAILPRADNTTQYEVVVVARVPQVSGPPILFEIDPIDWTSLNYTEELNRPSQLDVRCKVSSLTDDIVDRLKHMAELPTELLVYRNGVPTFAGPLLGWRVQGNSGDELSLQAMSLLGYLRYMYVTEDLLFDQVDQFTIAASLINHWQDKEFGHFGIDTSDIGTSGVLRYVTYPRDELHNIGQRIQALGERENGFDVAISPSSRRLILNSPRQGVDRSTGEDAIIFDSRNVRSPNVIASIAPGDVASEAFGIGEDGRYSAQSNLDLRVKFGRSGVAVSFYTVEEQATLDAYTAELLTARNQALVVPGPNARVTPDSDLSSYDVGDTITYKVHNRLFVGPGIFRIRKRRVSVSPTGQETVSLEFA